MSGDLWDEYERLSKPQKQAGAQPSSDPVDDIWAQYEGKTGQQPAAPAVPAGAGTPKEPSIGGTVNPDGSWKEWGKEGLNTAAKGIVKALIPLGMPISTAWDVVKKVSDHGLPDSDNLAGGAVRGVPGIRNLIPATEKDMQFQQEWPKTEMGANAFGNIGAGMATMGVGMPTIAGGSKLLQALKYGAGQGGVNAGVGTADRLTEDASMTWENAGRLAKGAGVDAGVSAAVPFLSRGMTPNARWGSEAGKEGAEAMFQRGQNTIRDYNAAGQTFNKVMPPAISNQVAPWINELVTKGAQKRAVSGMVGEGAAKGIGALTTGGLNANRPMSPEALARLQALKMMQGE